MPAKKTSLAALPAAVRRDIVRAGYYPALVEDVVAEAVAGEDVLSHLVHQETTFDHDEILRHVTVLALTTHRLVVAHIDDHSAHEQQAAAAFGRGAQDTTVVATSESVPLASVRGVMLTHVVPGATGYVPGSLGREVTVSLGWGAVHRVDLMPATCGDPSCDADHGQDGTVTEDDLALRVSADADGAGAVEQARAFARALSLATSSR